MVKIDATSANTKKTDPSPPIVEASASLYLQSDMIEESRELLTGEAETKKRPRKRQTNSATSPAIQRQKSHAEEQLQRSG